MKGPLTEGLVVPGLICGIGVIRVIRVIEVIKEFRLSDKYLNSSNYPITQLPKLP